MAEEKGEGRGRGKYTEKGVQKDQDARITDLEARVAALESAGETPTEGQTESEAPVEQPTTPTEVLSGGTSPTA